MIASVIRPAASSSSSPSLTSRSQDTFWNAGDEPARILEIISPAGFERFFDELVDLQRDGAPDLERLASLAARYGLDVDPSSIPGLVAEYGLVFPDLPE